MGHAQDLHDRFWSKVDKSGECWEWTAARFAPRYGRPSYGMFLVERRLRPAHRVAWQLERGDIPTGVLVLHHCDNPPCVRPDHLYLGTATDNTRDAVARRRTPDSERIGVSKLTADQVAAIKDRLAAGVATEKIGQEFGVSGRTVRYIRAGRSWKYA